MPRGAKPHSGPKNSVQVALQGLVAVEVGVVETGADLITIRSLENPLALALDGDRAILLRQGENNIEGAQLLVRQIAVVAVFGDDKVDPAQGQICYLAGMKILVRTVVAADDGRNGLVLAGKPAPVLEQDVLPGLGLEKILQHGIYEPR